MAIRPNATGLVIGMLVTFASATNAQQPERARPWDPEYLPPVNAWGQPDLQGNWTNATLTPFQREEGLGPAYTWEQVRRIESPEDECPANPGTVECGRTDRTDDASLSDEQRLSGAEYNEVYWDRGSEIAVVNGEPRTSLITFPANGRQPARSAAAVRRAETERAFRSQFEIYDHPELRSTSERCFSPRSAGPPILPNGAYNNNFTIVQGPRHVMIMAEMVHDARILKLGERRPLPDDIRLWHGDSWARYERGTLVVETTNLHPDQGSAEGTIIERFTRVSDDTILYEFEVRDPGTYVEPWGGQVPMKRLDDYLYEYACHEGNYSLQGVLSGARFSEQEAARSPR